MIAEQLKKAVLQAAIQGKLTEQLPADGDARDLVKQIQKEKSQLIKAGKLKKEQSLPEISEEEIPFEIPENWVWARLQDITSTVGDGLHGTPKYTDIGEYFFINGNNLHDGKIIINSYTKKVDAIEYHKYKKPLSSASILVSINGTLGNVAFFNNEKVILGKSACYFNLLGDISKIFIKYILHSKYYLDYSYSTATGTTIKNASLKAMRIFLVPLPPLAEQKRIVEKLDQVLSEINRLALNETKLDAVEKAFPKKMKDAILQYAIQGKLTEQLPDDGDARDLLKQIQKEKSQLIKEGKLKKQNPLPEISEDEIPFEIPENWVWVRLGSIFRIINGFTPLRSNFEFWKNKDIPWFTVEDIRDQGHIIESTKQYISKSAVSDDRIVSENSVLLCCTASIGEYALTKIKLTTNQQFNALTIRNGYEYIYYPMYFYYYVQTLTERLLIEAGKTTFPFLSTKKLSNFILPLPPLAEQQRIVEKLDQILPLCEALE